MRRVLLLVSFILLSLMVQAQVPTITLFTPASGAIGTPVTITGTNFSATASNNIVFFGATKAFVTTATTTQLAVSVPAGATYQPISVTVAGLTAYSSKPFITTFSAVGTIDASSFAAKTDFANGANPYSVSIGDLDGDGKSDLVLANTSSNTVSVFRNTGNSGSISYVAKVDFTTGATPISSSIGDLDGDGKADLVVTNFTGNTVSIFRNTGSADNISYAANVDFTTGTSPRSVSIGDLDGDGKADLAVANQSSNTVSIFRNTGSVGSINFSTKTDFTIGNTPVSVSIGDLDGDGKVDLAVANSNSNTVSVFRNTGSAGNISYAANVDFTTGTQPWLVSIGDLDGDGKADLAVANGGTNNVSVFRNTGSAGSISYASKVDFTTGTTPVSVSIGDLDGDGKVDLAVANRVSNTVSVFRNTGSTGNINFAAKVDFTTGTTPRFVSIGDLDGDGKADLAVANDNSNTVSVFKNSISTSSIPTITSFTPTSAGAGTTVTITGTNFTGVTAVSFGGTAATSFTFVSATSITAVVAAGTSGNVSVSTPGGIATAAGFIFIPAPTITSITPTSAGAGTTVTITGTNFTGVTAVSFSGTAATSFTFVSPTSITAVVAAGTSGNVSVTTPGGIATAAGFIFIPAPTITSISPTSAGASTTVTITGTNFTGASAVSFGGTFATSFTFVSATSITAVVAAGTSGNISVTTPSGIATAAGFIFIPAPTITSITPTSAGAGTTVTITGTNFTGVTAVSFGGTAATSFTFVSATSITTVVAAGTSGNVSVTTPGGIATLVGFTFDNLPPVVAANNTLSTVAPNSSITVSANFTDASGITTDPAPRVFYRPITGVAPNNFVSADMTLSTGTTYIATIPSSAVTELGVEYKYLVTDGVGLDNSASQTIYKTRINHSAGLSLTSYPANAAGSAVINYRIIAIPLVLVNKTINDIFNNDLGGYDPKNWRMFKYSGSSFNELNANSVVSPGEGYWFIANSSSPLNTGSGSTVNVSTSGPFTITLQPGWNQIGNPYNFNISWADVVAANPAQSANLGGNNSKIRVFRGAIDNVDVLNTLEGGFVKYLGTSETSISIPVSKNLSIQGRKGSVDLTTNSLDQDAWEIFFTLKNGATDYTLGGIGMHPEAKEDFDYFDDFNSPRFIEYLEVRFPKKYAGMTYTKDVVPTIENKVWEFKVESNLNEETTSINWDNTYFGNQKKIFLLDVTSHRVIDMNITSHYVFNTAKSRDFKIVFGNPDFVKQELMPAELILFEPYPNPFTNQVIIEYAIPNEMVESKLKIEILNSIGSEISSVPISQKKAGSGSWIWECDGLPPGLYFVRLKIGDQYKIKKLIKN